MAKQSLPKQRSRVRFPYPAPKISQIRMDLGVFLLQIGLLIFVFPDDIIEIKPLKGVSIMAEKKEIQYVSDNAQLMAEWNWEKNAEISPSEIMAGSSKVVWWKCKNGHEWQAVIKSRNSGCNCPYCSGLHAITGETDLQTVNPTLASEWNYEKNDGLMPNKILPNSNQKVWWKCSKGHEWQATVSNRNIGNSCPYCSGKKVLAGYNDLKTVNSDLAKEWNYEKTTY